MFDKHTFDKLRFVVMPEWERLVSAFAATDDGTFVYVVVSSNRYKTSNRTLALLDNKFTGRLDGAFAKNFPYGFAVQRVIWPVTVTWRTR